MYSVKSYYALKGELGELEFYLRNLKNGPKWSY